MFRLYSHFWRACCFLLLSCIIHVQKAMNVSAKITRVAGLAPWSSFDGVRPSNYCVLVSKRHVFYELFEATLGIREKPVFYGTFEALCGVRKWREPARGNGFRRDIGGFFDAKERQNIVSSIYRGPIFIVNYNGFPTSSRKSRIASLNQ